MGGVVGCAQEKPFWFYHIYVTIITSLTLTLQLYHKIKNNELAPIRPGTDLSKDGTLAVVEFVTASVAVFENEKKVRVEVDRYGLESNQVQVK